MDHTPEHRLKCRACKHAKSAHDPICRNGLDHHSGYGENVRCQCVPGQLAIDV